MKINQAIRIVFDSDMIVYPIIDGKGFKIAFKRKNKPEEIYKKLLKQGAETSDALYKTYIFLAKKIEKGDM